MKTLLQRILISISFFIIITSCSKEDSPQLAVSQESLCENSSLTLSTATNSNTATATCLGGQSPYTYLWSNGSTDATATNLEDGVYTVIATDKLGCTKTAEAKINTIDVGPTVTIGTQVWMVRNLDVDHFRNGDPIVQLPDNSKWFSSLPAWCYYEFNPANGPIYGKLYSWYTANDPRGLAPEGWHIPSKTEWLTLISYLGENKAGDKLKDITLWKSLHNVSTNSTGFSALPGGALFYGGQFAEKAIYGYWWSSTKYATFSAWNFELHGTYSNASVSNFYGAEDFMSVRCIKD